MLILTRKAEQGIVIDGHTTVRVLAVEGERVKLGIDAPQHITVLREELVAEVGGQNREAIQRRPAPGAVERLRRLERGGAGGDGAQQSAPREPGNAAPPPEQGPTKRIGYKRQGGGPGRALGAP